MMKDKNWCDLGWVSTVGSNERLNYGVRYPKKDRLWGLAVIGSFMLLGVSVHWACRSSYFRGAHAGIDAELEALETIDVLKK